MNNMKHGKLEFEVVDPDSGDADLFQIKKTAQNIRERMGKINAAEHWIAIGGELQHLHDQLARPTGRPGRGHNERVGWKKAFELGLMPITKSYAGYLMKIWSFVNVHGLNTLNLPSNIKPLYVLVTILKDAESIKRLVSEGKITPASTEMSIKDLAHEIGLLTKRIKPGVDRHSPKSRRVTAALKYVQRLGLTINDLKQGDK
jgi:hypothetical protein